MMEHGAQMLKKSHDFAMDSVELFAANDDVSPDVISAATLVNKILNF